MTALSTSLEDGIECRGRTPLEKDRESSNESDTDSYDNCDWSDCESMGLGVNFSELQFDMDFVTDETKSMVFEKAKDSFDPIKYSWFGCEDKEQVRTIIDIYENNLGVGKERRLCIRSSKPFIGRICRQRLNLPFFATLDKVEVFYNDYIPEGTVCPRGDEFTVLTRWDENGLPSQTRVLKNLREIKSLESNTLGDTSYLYCIPSIGNFKYASSNEFLNVTFSRESFSFAPFIPRRSRFCDSKMDFASYSPT